MAKPSNKSKLSMNDFWEVSHAAAQFTGFACTISARHLQDDQTRMQFNRELAYFARRVVRDVEERRLSPQEGLRELKAEQQSLLSESHRIVTQTLGLIGGTVQVASGAGICYGSVGTLCAPLGAPLIIHGGNNIYENARNLYERSRDVEGPVRKAYQGVAKQLGYSETEGNMAYLTGDLAMSGAGLLRQALKPDAWRLYRYIKTDHERAYKQMSKKALAMELLLDAQSAQQLNAERKK
ncbi:DUF4225 domain-containing protein [Pseudomonas alkylphenolica]|uniref:DUF4225 domain-containing protein n=1 Tax=Pseudomonas alkylphenolica TaxID=237609 RepID=A0A077FAN2_9PSED|nr:DUF4225 domain-containing protein [Pseudomonas alkylphenolica]AIL62477.1 hypothetical protein PSAKL28_33170 [Pseudomonas alkylphenolica]